MKELNAHELTQDLTEGHLHLAFSRLNTYEGQV